MKKKGILILLSVGFVILLISLSLIYVRFSSSENKYEKLLESCSSTKESSYTDISCKAFIESVSEEGKDMCFNLLVIQEDYKFEEVTICEKVSNIDWTNPYDDYSRLIPVSILVKYKTLPFLNLQYDNSVKIYLLKDEETLDFLYNVEENTFDVSNVRIKENEDIVDKGYYVTGKVGSGVEDTLVFMDVAIEEILIKGDDIILHLVTSIDGKRVKLELVTEGFEYVSSVDYERVVTDVSVSNADILDTEEVYQLLLGFDSESFKLNEFIETILLEKGEYFVIDSLELRYLSGR